MWCQINKALLAKYVNSEISSKENIELLPNGGVNLTSKDEASQLVPIYRKSKKA